jgi:hypothetical protein
MTIHTQTKLMQTIRKLTVFLAVVAASPFAAASPPQDIAKWEAALAAREQRSDLFRSELKALDARIEARVDSLVAALRAVGDSKDSRTKVARMKEQTIGALKKSISYYQGKRATLQEELRRPTLRLTDEQKRRGIAVFDARMEKRVAQILELQKSLPTEKDYERYKATGSNAWGTEYAINEDYKQNRRVTAVTNTQRKEIETGLRNSIARIEQQNRTLRANGAPGDEIAKNDVLLAERRQQLAVALAPIETPTRKIGGKEAAGLDKALNTSIADLRQDFDTLFARYNALIQELSAINSSRASLTAFKSKP